MDTGYLVIGAVQLALGIVWFGLVVADRRRPPARRRNFKDRTSLTAPTVIGVVWLLLGLWWLGRGLWG
jgi:hypothetical protein